MPTPIRVLLDLPPHEPSLHTLRRDPQWALSSSAEIGDPEESRTLPEELIRDAEILFCNVPPPNLAAMRDLKLVQIASAGFGQLIGLGLPERGIRACNSTGVFDTAIAEWNVAMMVNLTRDVRRMLQNQVESHWDRSDPKFQRQIFGSTVGLWGYGGIGRQTARLCKAMGMTVHVLTRHGVHPRRDQYCIAGTGDVEGALPDRVFVTSQTHEFLAGLDFLILSMPLTPENEGIVGEAELRALPRHAYVLNPARGPLIQEQALVEALKQGWIAGAALDTHYQYPLPPEHPLWSYANVILTPHISGSSGGDYFAPRVWDLLLQNLDRYAGGRSLLNELPPSALR